MAEYLHFRKPPYDQLKMGSKWTCGMKNNEEMPSIGVPATQNETCK